MHNSLLVKVIASLNQKERTHFRSFLNVSYFNPGNRSKSIIQLWDLINKELKNPAEIELSKPNVYNILFPNQPIYRGKLEKLMSQLLRLINKFIVMEGEALAAKTVKYQLAVYKQYMERGLEEEAKQKVKTLLSQQTKVKTTPKKLYDQFLIDQFFTQVGSFKNSRREDLNLPQTIESLDQHYLLTKLEYAIQLLATNQWIAPIDYGDLLDRLDLSLTHVSAKLKKKPIFSLYLLAYQLLRDFQEGNAPIFKKLLDEIEQNKSHCTKEQLKALQALSRNYCIYFYHQGDDELIQLGYQLYRTHLKEGLLYHQEKILVGTFCNLVLLGILNKDLAWVKTFIDNHKAKISGSDENQLIYDFNLAVLAFHQQSYEKALDLLAMNFQDQYLKLASRRLEIMIYYELQSPIFISKLEAYKIYVYRLTEETNLKKSKDQNRNFVDILKQIQHPKTFGNQRRIQKLLTKIKTTKNLAEKPWLLEKLLALKK